MCGTIASKYYPGPDYITDPNPRFVKAVYCSNGGDSGAAVINGHDAIGIHGGFAPSDAGGFPRAGCDVRPHLYAWFTSMTYALGQLDATLVRD